MTMMERELNHSTLNHSTLKYTPQKSYGPQNARVIILIILLLATKQMLV